MSSTLIEAINLRAQGAHRRAVDAAAAIVDPTGDGAEQIRLEEALSDLAHYRGLARALDDDALGAGPYRRGGLIRDVVAAATRGAGDAVERLNAHRRAVDALEGRAAGDALSSAVSGAMVPAYLIETAGTTATAPLVAAIGRTLPASGLTITYARWTAAPTPAAQATELAAAATSDVTLAAASAGVKTYATRINLSQQVYDRASAAVDGVLLPAMAAEINDRIDSDAIAADGTSGTIEGILEAADTTAAAYTDGTPTAAEFLAAAEAAYRTSTAARGGGADLMVMHPRRWSWLRQRAATEGLTAMLGPSTRPGCVARYGGELDICSTDSMPTNRGTGTNQDAVIVCGAEDLRLWLGPMVIEADRPTSMADGAVLLVAHRYVAASIARPAAVVIIDGTGLVTPA